MKFRIGHRFREKVGVATVWRTTALAGPGPYVWQPFKDRADEYSQERAAGIVAASMEDLKEGEQLVVERSS